MTITNFRGFISNAHDTKIMSSYVDENFPNGLKENSKKYLGYDQQTYAEVTTITGHPSEMPKGGKIIATGEHLEEGQQNGEGIPWVTKQYRMNELTAEHVLAYGADDTICTAALYNFYQTVMEIEKTWEVYKAVEVKPAYLTALAYTQGVPVSIERLKELEREDDKAFENAKATLTKVLLEKGYLDKMWQPMTEMTAAGVKDACEELFGFRPETKVRSMDKLAKMIRVESGAGDSDVLLNDFCAAVERGDMHFINELLKAKFKKDPGIDIGSSKKMQQFLYHTLGLPVRVVNHATDTERLHNKPLVQALYKYQKFQMKGETPDLTDAEWALVRTKASGDATAIDFALLYDKDLDPDITTILKSIKAMRTVMTRRGLYYAPYPSLLHWKDGKIHSSMNQCATVTRRYSSSGPNLQQLPKKGEGVKIREMILPHHKDAVVVSLDFSGQELRIAANDSRDANMLACYIGDRLKDIHSITAAGAMEKKWGKAKLNELVELIKAEAPKTDDDFYDTFIKLRKHPDETIAKMADDLRKVAKNVNFGAQYDAQALTLAMTLIIPVKDAQDFLDAREKMFPGVSTRKDEIRASVERNGYATTLMGARRHLAALLANKITANKAGRQGPNFRIQGSAAEQTKLAMGEVWGSGVCHDYDMVFYAPVHDELVFSVHRDQAVDVIRIVHECMTKQYAGMIVPCMSSISLGPNFGHQIECGDWFIEENIRNAINEVFSMNEAA